MEMLTEEKQENDHATSYVTGQSENFIITLLKTKKVQREAKEDCEIHIITSIIY